MAVDPHSRGHARFSGGHGPSTRASARGVRALEQGLIFRRRLWERSARACNAKRCIHCVCVVKHAFSGFPHAWITEKMMKAGRLYGKSWCRRRALQQHRPPTPRRQGAGTGADQLDPQQAPRLALLPQLAFERLRGVETDTGFPPFNL